jgi:light-regulated signal transduction histidine kinase (bacteriophytochrome)
MKMRGMSDKLPRANRKYRHILSIVKKIIDNQGESIWVEYSAGEGATFYFTWHKNPPS